MLTRNSAAADDEVLPCECEKWLWFEYAVNTSSIEEDDIKGSCSIGQLKLDAPGMARDGARCADLYRSQFAVSELSGHP